MRDLTDPTLALAANSLRLADGSEVNLEGPHAVGVRGGRLSPPGATRSSWQSN
jgi:hypothetical protein